jgi:hypothetical protein
VLGAAALESNLPPAGRRLLLRHLQNPMKSAISVKEVTSINTLKPLGIPNLAI